MNTSATVKHRAQAARRIGVIAASTTVLIGMAVAIGHIARIDTIVSPFGIPMTVSTALGLIVAGVGLLAWYDGPSKSPVRRTLVIACGSLVAVVALALAIGVLAGRPWGFDLSGHRYPAVPSLHTTLALTLIGTWLAIVPFGRMRLVRLTVQGFAWLTVAIAMFGLIYRVPYLLGEQNAIGLAPQTAIAMALLCGAVSTARPHEGIVRLIIADSAGGLLARRLAPAVLWLPLLVSFLVVSFLGELNAANSATVLLLITGLNIIMTFAAVVVASYYMDRQDSERRRLMDELDRQAHTDPLTGLANVRRFRRELDAALRAQGPHQRSGTGVVVLDLDGLKPVNDSFGHSAGDDLIIGVARTLLHGVRVNDLVARIGGDEYGVLLYRVNEQEASQIVERLVRSVATASFGHRAVSSSVSAGAVLVRRSGADPDQVLTEADAAMYAVKSSGGNGFGLVPHAEDSSALATAHTAGDDR